MLALADDATGALETGARISQAGMECHVFFLPGSLPSFPAVIDTESRHLSSDAAYARLHNIAHEATGARVARIFKKTDSTLRGPIAAEFRALLDAWPDRPLIYAPAYPELGRTVRHGRLYVNGEPLHRTAFATDPLNPSRESSIAAVLRDAAADIVCVRNAAEIRSRLAPGRILICDGDTDRDLAAVAEAAREVSCIVAGTAALASAWAGPLRRTPSFRARTALVVNGSLHPASRSQIDACRLPEAKGDGRHGWTALCCSPERAGDPVEVAAAMAKAVARMLAAARPECLVVFGGDTLFAILRELGVDRARASAEILPGAAVSTIDVGGPLLLVSKAGGFGPPDYLARIRGILEKE